MDVNEYFDLYNCYITWNMRLIEILVGIYTGDIYIYTYYIYNQSCPIWGVSKHGGCPNLIQSW
jgi:hypothetical protein